MDIWESYEKLPPLVRIIVIFMVTLILIITVFWIGRRARNEKRIISDMVGIKEESKQSLFNNLQQKANGSLVAYIAFWRYLIFGLLFAAASYISINSLIRLCQELPVGFWKNWDRNTTTVFVVLIIAILMPLMGFIFLKGCYRKVQFEIDNYHVRYLTSAIRGGILLSENYVSVPLKKIIKIELRNFPLGGGKIIATTATQTHSIILLLSYKDQEVCYRVLDNAIKNWQSKNHL